MNRLKRWLDTWQEAVIWLPVALLITCVAYYLIPYIDPKAGIDGFGGLFNFLMQVVKGIGIFFLAWLTKRTYLACLDCEEEDQLAKDLKVGEDSIWWRAYLRLALDRLEWALAVGLWLFIVIYS